MTRHSLRIPWAGPAVVAALLLSLPAPQPAHAAPVAALTGAQIDQGLCIHEAVEFVQAMGEWVSAWNNYTNSLPGGTAQEIQGAVDQLNRATNRVMSTGVKFLLCLMKYMD